MYKLIAALTVCLLIGWAFVDTAKAQSTEAAASPALPKDADTVDISVFIERENSGDVKVLISAREGTEFRIIKSIVSSLADNEESVFWSLDPVEQIVFLSVVPESKPLHAPRTTGDEQIGIKLLTDGAEVFVTDRVPFVITMRVCEALSKIDGIESVRLKGPQVAKPSAGHRRELEILRRELDLEKEKKK